MPPYTIPYGAVPVWCFPMFELSAYVLFALCLLHAIKQGRRHVAYLLGGVVFGLILEYIEVISGMGYTYGQFMVMFGKAPLNIPLCIGIGWGIIMYTARLFSAAGPGFMGRSRAGHPAGHQHRPQYGYRGLPNAHVDMELGRFSPESAHRQLVWHTLGQFLWLDNRSFLLFRIQPFIRT